MKSKISSAFEKCKKEKRPALLTYTVAGDNTKKNSLKILSSNFQCKNFSNSFYSWRCRSKEYPPI